MTNAEKYKNTIMAQMRKTGDWALNKSGEIMPCACEKCADCEFNINSARCGEVQKEWLNAEAKKVFPEKDKEVLRALDKVQWVARDENGILYGYHNKPYKFSGIWFCAGDYVTDLTTLTTAEFAPVKREDDEPTSREEILGDEK